VHIGPIYRRGELGNSFARPPACASQTTSASAEGRIPLLFIGFEKDHVVPPKATMHNERKYDDSVSITEYEEFEGRPHFPGAPGWEEVADFAIDWAERHAGPNGGGARSGEGSRLRGMSVALRGGLASYVSDDHRKHEACVIIQVLR
jgi:hypothetical protein